jgi:hypothetical protein
MFEVLGLEPDPATLRSEILSTKSESGLGTPIESVLEVLVRDSAQAWKLLGLYCPPGAVAYRDRVFARADQIADTDCRLFARLVASVESSSANNIPRMLTEVVRRAGIKTALGTLPTPAACRRMRVVTGTLPLYLPVSTRGVGNVRSHLWRLLWMDALGVTAPKIARALQFSEREPVRRGQIWRLRKKAYSGLAARLGALA